MQRLVCIFSHVIYECHIFLIISVGFFIWRNCIYIAFDETKNSSGSPPIVLLFLECNVLHLL